MEKQIVSTNVNIDEFSILINSATSLALEALSLQEGIDLSALLMAAICLLYYRYTGREEFVAASCNDNSNSAGLDYRVQRLHPLDNASFIEFAHHLQEQLKVESPFVAEMGDIQVHFSHHAGMRNEKRPLRESAPADLSLSICYGRWGQDGQDRNLACRLMCSPTFINSILLPSLQANFIALIESILSNPRQQIGKLAILSLEERQKILTEWNCTEKKVPHEFRYHELFERQVTRLPDKIAAIYQEECLTYAELNRRVNRIAHSLLEAGTQSDSVVALYASRGVDYLAAILAIFKTGSVYMPLDMRFPSARLCQVLQQSQTKYVITAREDVVALTRVLEELPTGTRPKTLILEDLKQNTREDNLGISYPSDKLAYILFTSGSTGTPKGAMVEHRGMINHLYGKINDLSLSERDVIAHVAPVSFDVSVFQFVVALLLGATVLIYEEEVAQSPGKLIAAVKKDGVTILEVVPTFLRLILNYIVEEMPASFNLPDLRWMVPTGETLPVSLTQEWLSRFPDIPLLNTYGPTECSDDVMHYPIYKPLPTEVTSIPIGRPIGNMRIYILDKYLEPVPVGVAGEIYVGGIGVGKGYVNDEQRTALSFMPDPFSAQPGARMYKTSDLGRWLPDGCVEFLGRVDFQVKINGHRIELAEIEVNLEKHENINQCLVTTFETAAGRQQLVAYFTPIQTPAPSTQELRQFLSQRLPNYMVPLVFVPMETFPLNTSGKIDRKALPKPILVQTIEKKEAHTLVEEKLVGMWCEVLKIEGIGIQDNYFELGGDSLAAIILFANIEKEFNVNLHLSTIIKAPTIQQMGILIEESMQKETPPSCLVEIQSGNSKPPFFFVHAHGGHILFYYPLSTYIGADQPFYALQAQGLDGKEPPLTCFEDMAARYVQEIRTVQSHGPYYIGGDCLGGYIVYEMAQILLDAGEEVAFLAMVDTYAPGWPLLSPMPPNYIYRPMFYLQRLFKVHLSNLIHYSWPEKWQYVRTIWKHSGDHFALGRIQFAKKGHFNKDVKIDPIDLVYTMLGEAERVYRPSKPYPGKITLFRADTLPFGVHFNNDFGWSQWAQGGVEIHKFKNLVYETIHEPNSRKLGERLRMCLEKAQQEHA